MTVESTMRHFGFTGTRDGMSPSQVEIVRTLLFVAGVGGAVLHHGDCVGADADAHAIARELKYQVVGHPPEDDSARAFKDCDSWWDPKPYLTRNRNIVDISGLLIAAPNGFEEQLRSGTWATIRYAKKVNGRIIVVYPNGSTDLFGYIS